ncbi:MAG: helix-turn-helix domain-containing protein [Bacteroidetes bacterium]|nr:helix-turn-helix domain-containing protein [Bacteroidota bacterium]
MSGTNFTILKQCGHCDIMFEAQKRTTRFCSPRCASLNYKLRKRLELKKGIEAETKQTLRTKPKVNTISLELIKDKEFLNVKELAALFVCGKDTIYRMIKSNGINAVNLNKKLTRIRRKDIEQLFDNPKKQKPETLTVDNCYTMEQLIGRYGISRNTIYGYVTKHNIERIKENGITYYSKTDIDNLFKA